MHLLEGPDTGHSTGKGKQEKTKTAPGGIQTHNLQIMRRVFYRCATNATLF